MTIPTGPTPLSLLWTEPLTLFDSIPDVDLVPDIDAWSTTPSIQYYLGYPTSEYITKPNFMAMLQLLLTPFNDAAYLACNMYSYLSIDNAVGVQLDLLGELIGQSRTINFNPTNGSSPTLNDGDYQVLLKATIIKNMWNGTIPSLYASWATLFPGGIIVIQDNQDMSMNVILSGNFTSNIHDLIINGYIVPRPEGVLVNYSLGTLPVFGFDLGNAYIQGWDQGYWLVT